MTSTATLPTVALACVIAGCSPGPQSGASDAPGAPRPGEFATPYDDAVAAATEAVRAAEARAQAEPAAWIPRETLALALLDRAQLTGSYDDYGAADRALQQAVSGARAPGPCLAAARVRSSLGEPT